MRPKKVIPDETYEGMYRLSFGKGIISDNMWNLTRANDMLKNYDIYLRREKRIEWLRINSPLLSANKSVHKSLEAGS